MSRRHGSRPRDRRATSEVETGASREVGGGAAGPGDARVHDRTIIDYVRVTHDDGTPLLPFLRGPTEKLKTGVGMYPLAHRDGYGTILAEGGPSPRPFMLQLSGKPLASWRAERRECDLIFELAKAGVHCTRIDLARDTSGEWTPYRLRAFLDADRYVSPWRAEPLYIQRKRGPLTVELGSRFSDVMLRCYDKRGERLAAGKPCPFPRLSRFELEIKGKLAPRAFEKLATLRPIVDVTTGEERWPIEGFHAAWLASRLKLTGASVDREGKNQKRALVHPSWARFLSASNGSVLDPAADERSAAQIAWEHGKWVKRLGASLTTIEAIVGPEGIATLVEGGTLKLSAKHRMLIEKRAETQPALRGVLGL